MKRIILSVMVVAFAVAVQAGDAKTCQVKDKDKPACCPSKVKSLARQAKAGATAAPFAKGLPVAALQQASAGQANRVGEPEGR